MKTALFILLCTTSFALSAQGYRVENGFAICYAQDFPPIPKQALNKPWSACNLAASQYNLARSKEKVVASKAAAKK